MTKGLVRIWKWLRNEFNDVFGDDGGELQMRFHDSCDRIGERIHYLERDNATLHNQLRIANEYFAARKNGQPELCDTLAWQWDQQQGKG